MPLGTVFTFMALRRKCNIFCFQRLDNHQVGCEPQQNPGSPLHKVTRTISLRYLCVALSVRSILAQSDKSTLLDFLSR